MNNIKKKMYYIYVNILQMLTFKNPCCDLNPDSNEPVDKDPDPGTQRWPIRTKMKKVQVFAVLLDRLGVSLVA